MSITSKRGDDGRTDLMYGRRVAKTDPRVEACGTVDELNAALGVARVAVQKDEVRARIAAIQDELIVLMGELMTLEEDRERYVADGFKSITEDRVDALTEIAAGLEKDSETPAGGWAVPGAGGSAGAAQLDLARTACRRAERAVAGLSEKELISNPEILRYLNRLSDVLWLLAREEES